MTWLIRLYQMTLSPDHGPLRILFPNGFCRFFPSCSEYGRQAYEKFGFIRGTKLAVGRLIRCHPWHPPGIDEVPKIDDRKIA